MATRPEPARWLRCDYCGRRRPQVWFRLGWWWCRGGIAGYWDYCTESCEADHGRELRQAARDARRLS